MPELSLDRADALQLWAVLGEEGKAPTEIGAARTLMPAYSVGVDDWINRLAKLYLQDLCQKYAHFKVVLAPYGGGKTHFLMALGARALEEGFAVAYVPCGPGVSLASPLDIYRVFAKHVQLPGDETPGIRSLLQHVVNNKRRQIEEHLAPDPNGAFERWLQQLKQAPHPENAFGRVIVEALREAWDPEKAASADAAIRWLQGDVDTLTKGDLQELHLQRLSAKAQDELGRNLLLSVARFVQQAGVHGIVLLFDEVETLFNQRGKALLRVLSAMRVLIDLPNGVVGGVPMLGVFSAVPDVLQELGKYPALQQRLAVLGASFDQGNDLATQLLLERMAKQEELLAAIGKKLINVGEKALGFEFDRSLQSMNAESLAHVAAELSLEVDARRLYVKAWVNLLNLQRQDGERSFPDGELANRYRGYFDDIRSGEEAQEEEP